MANPLEAARLDAEPVALDPVAREAAAWDHYMALTARWGVAFEPATEHAAHIGARLNQLGASLQSEPDLGWYYAELVRGFVAFSDHLSNTAEAFETVMKAAERDWRRALDAVAEPERGWIEARRLAERHADRQFEVDLDEE